MKKLESTLPNMVIVLTCVTLVSAALLGVMQQLTKEPIEQIERQTLNDGIKKVILAGKEGELSVSKTDTISNRNGVFIVYTAEVDGKVAGRAVKTSVNGFSPNLTVLTGFDSEGKILGYEILATAETPGLGAKAGQWFQKDGKGCIIGKTAGDLKVSKDGGDVDAITASTITSRAFLKAVNIEYDAIFGGDATTGATSACAPAEPDTAGLSNDSIYGVVADTLADESAELRPVVD